MAEGESTTIIQTSDVPRSPTAVSSSSSRKDSLRSSNNTDKESVPSPPITRLMRKRVASLDTNAANDPSIGNLSIHSASIGSPRADSNSYVCLCQHDPKIPRPRNAFILYRQRYQGQVIAQNPGLSNPEISKIIGAQWRDQPLDVKNEWKRLAEEEKHRHQRQYPDYRYQPRRPGKLNISRVTGAPDNSPRCPKCNGRYISTPGTPLTPLPPTALGGGSDHVIQPFSHPVTETAMNSEGGYATNPRTRFPDFRPSSTYPQMDHHRPQLQPHQQGRQWLNADVEMLQSPAAKRPRPNDNPNPYPSPSWPNSIQHLSHAPISAISYDPARIPNQRMASYQNNGNHGMMEPPPRPSPMAIQFPHSASVHARPQTMDELRLPPLQTKIAGPGSAPPQQHQSQQQLTQLQRISSLSNSQSVEAMVMTIPFLNKIRVLAKIAPPLVAPGPSSPVQEVRGPVIAVEGADQNLVAEVGKFIEDHLNTIAECLVRTWNSNDDSLGKHQEPTLADISMSGVESNDPTQIGNTNGSQSKGPIFDYIETISAWHSKSAEIRKFITTVPQSKFEESKSPSPTTKPLGPFTSPNIVRRLPIALLPTGFSLSLSDRAASQIPIDDAYAPVDHWQWMATLWRGIIGADLTVYVCSEGLGEEEGGRGAPPGMGGVEVRNDVRAIIIYATRGKLEDKWLRRVGFEVGEFVIGGGSKG